MTFSSVGFCFQAFTAAAVDLASVVYALFWCAEQAPKIDVRRFQHCV
jgi:hypothetical protein